LKIESAQYARSARSEADLPKDHLPQFAFVGRSNVGKSSLLNRLLGRKGLARTSSTPGRTQAIHYFLVNSRFYFVDLPGYGYAKVAKRERRAWAELMEMYLKETAEKIRVIQLVDAKVGATPLDVQAYEYLDSLGIEPIVVATRADRVKSSQRHKALAGISAALEADGSVDAIPVSAKTGEGVREVWREIRDHLHPDQTNPPRGTS
jgi:GTP-binding protein